MKKVKPIISLIVVILTFNVYSAHVNGTAFLDNSTNHSDILIKFIPVSPSAVLDSTITNSSGLFSIDVENGVYDITYSKTGYQSYTLQSQLLSDTVTLEGITLSSTSIIYISGNVGGEWNSDNTYVVIDDIYLELNDTLIISPGTEIKFDGSYNLNVFGTLIANGTGNNPILFTSNSPSPSNVDWKGIIFNESSSNMLHCIVEYAVEQIRIFYSNLNIDQCVFRHSIAVGFDILGGSSIIQNSDFYDFDNWAFRIEGEGDDTRIEHNEIHDMSYGIIARSGVQIRYNKFYSNSTAILCKGPALVEYNIFHDNTRGINSNNYDNTRGINSTNIWEPQILNNTFYNNYIAIQFDGSTDGIMKMNIISNNSKGINIENLSIDFTIEYNLFHDNLNWNLNNPPVGFGFIVTNNNNGTPCDTYYNIFENPEFLSTTPADSTYLYLGELSPAINAGNPEYLDPDSSIRDIGAFPYIPNSSIELSSFDNNTLTPFPNPFKNEIYFEIDSYSLKEVELKIIDLYGKCIKTMLINKNCPEIIFWDSKDEFGNSISPGIYIYKIGDYSGIILKE
ncbi:MAG: hypothetical protein K8R86_03365 [Bacteroidales bacterium]|nr:hypothetical protein [Bacteroidales bacterium]